MKDNNKEDISNSKLESKKNINDNDKNNNEIGQIKYFHFNEVKKIVNNKNKKAPVANKNEDKRKNQIKSKNLKKEEEDSYRKNIYKKKLIITKCISSSNVIKSKYHLYKNEKNDINNFKNWNSTDERYKTIKKFGLITKKFLQPYKSKKPNKRKITSIKKGKFSKNNKLKRNNKSKVKLITNQRNIIDLHDINNINSNNSIFDFNNINEFNNSITSNTITSKTITNNTMSNNTISNLSPTSYYNNMQNNINLSKNSKIVQNLSKTKELKEEGGKGNKNNNIKVLKNKGRNKNNKNIIKCLKNKYSNDGDEKENTVFIRRIILEEKFTIDSKGDKKTIYIKEVSPIFQSSDIVNSADKRLIKKNKINKNNNTNYNNKDNTFINHNDINLNFNVCSFQKINFNNNNNNTSKKNVLNAKLENYDDEYKINFNNNKNINDSIFQNYKDFLNIKNSPKIIYQKPNRILNKSEKNHKSYQSLFSSPNKAYFMKFKENDLDKKNPKINHKVIINNMKNFNKLQNNQNAISISNNNNTQIKKNLTKEYKAGNLQLKQIKSNPRFLKNKLVHRKVKTNLNNNENNDNINEYNNNPEDEKQNPFLHKRSLSFVGQVKVFNLVKKVKDNKKLEMKDKIKNNNISNNMNNSPSNSAIKHYANKPKEFISFTPMISGKSSKNNTKLNSKNNSKIIKKKVKNKKNLFIDGNTNDISNNITRCHSLNKKDFNSNEIKEFLNYLKNNKNTSGGRNKSHKNFYIKKKEKYYLDNILNKNLKNKNSNNNKGNYSNIICKKSK